MQNKLLTYIRKYAILYSQRDFWQSLRERTGTGLETHKRKSLVYIAVYTRQAPKTKPIKPNKFYFMEVISLWHAITKKAMVILQMIS